MKPLKEIYADKRLFKVKVEQDGGTGYLLLNGNNVSKAANVVWSYDGGWDHVSVSYSDRCPVWEEMCKAKEIFFKDDECCIEYHPSKDKYVNFHPYCLHIWRPQNARIPQPPMLFV